MIKFSNIYIFQGQEREQQEKINEDAKELEKMTNKQSLLLKKVRKSKERKMFNVLILVKASLWRSFLWNLFS